MSDPIDPIWTGVPETKIDPSHGRPIERVPWVSEMGGFFLTLALMVIVSIVAFIVGWAAPG